MIDQRIHNLVIDEGQQSLAHFDQGHARPQRGEHAGVFAADHAAADHRQRLRQMIQLEQAIAGEDRLAIKRDAGGLGHGRAHRDHDAARRQFVLAFLAHKVEVHRVLIDDGGDAGEKLDAVALQLMPADLDLVANHVVGAQQQVVHRDVFFDHVRGAVDRALAEAGEMQHRLAQCL